MELSSIPKTHVDAVIGCSTSLPVTHLVESEHQFRAIRLTGGNFLPIIAACKILRTTTNQPGELFQVAKRLDISSIAWVTLVAPNKISGNALHVYDHSKLLDFANEMCKDDSLVIFYSCPKNQIAALHDKFLSEILRIANGALTPDLLLEFS